MTIASRHRYTLGDYLDVEEMSPVRHEYLSGEIFAMAGDTPEHAALSAAVVVLLGKRLEGGPCRPYSADLCEREHYQRIHSLREHVLVSQDRRSIEVFSRGKEGSAWTPRPFATRQIVELASLGITFPVDELYDAAGSKVT